MQSTIHNTVRRGRRDTRRPMRQRQRGAFAVLAAVFLLFSTTLLLGTVFLGTEFYQRRQLQSEADLAALSAVQEINADPTCTGVAKSVAVNTAQTNGYASSNPTPTVTCGYWLPTGGAGGTFSTTVPSGAVANAVQVKLSQANTYFSGSIAVSAMARNLAQDTFSLTSTLATLNGGIINQLLNGLLGGIFGGNAFNLSLSIGDYQNLAAVNLNLLDIAANITAASTTAALTTSITLGQLVQAEIAAATQESVASVNLNVLQALSAQLGVNGGPTLQLGSLLGLSAANGSSALDASVNALGLLTTAVETAYASANSVSIANGTNFLQLPLSLNLPSNPLLNASVTAYLQLLQPPTIASGQAGKNASGQYYTFAQSAVGKVFLRAQISSTLLATSINLPIWLYVGPSTAGLDSINCTAASRSASMTVTPGVLGAYIGGSLTSPPKFNAGTGAVTSGGSTPPTIQLAGGLLTISIGGANGLSLPLTSPGGTVTFSYPSSGQWSPTSSTNPPYSQTSSTDVVSAAGDLVNTVLAQLSNPSNLTVSLLGIPITLLSDIVSVLSPILTGILNPLFAALDAIVTPLLQLLGLQVGSATVQNFPAAITCSPSLVQ